MVDNPPPRMTKWQGFGSTPTRVCMIESDVSLRGWGATCQETRDPWFQDERQYYINCLEILAAHLVIKTFLKNKDNAGADRQHNSNVKHQSPRKDSVSPGD